MNLPSSYNYVEHLYEEDSSDHEFSSHMGEDYVEDPTPLESSRLQLENLPKYLAWYLIVLFLLLGAL